MRRLARPLLLGAVLFALAGCDTEPQLMEPSTGALAPDFTLPDRAGRPWQLSRQRGRTLLVNFWATWCGPCRREMPALERLQQALGGDAFQVVGIHVGPDTGIERFLEEVPISFTLLTDAELALENWKVPMLPATFLIDAEGHARYWALGEREWDAPEALAFFAALEP